MSNQFVKLGEVCDFQGGSQPPKSEHIHEKKPGYIRFIQIRDFESDDYLTFIPIDKKNKICQEDDVLIARYGASIGKILTGLSGAYNVALIKCIPDEKRLQKRFLYYYLNTSKIQKFIQSRSKRSAQEGVDPKELKQQLIYLPSLETQNRIVYVLDKAQELIDKRKAQIEALDQLTQSVFLEMFGDPIKNTNQYKKEKLANLCIKITDGTHHSPPTVKEGIPYITAKHLNKGGLDFFKDPTYVSLEDHQKIYERCNPEKGDVLYIKDGATTGIAAINHYDFEFSMLSSLALIKVDFNKLNNYYLTHFLNNERVFRKITSGMNGGAIKRLTLKKINNIEVVVPPIELQNQFAEIIKKIEIQKELLQKSLEELENNFSSLMQQAFRGELFNDQ